MQFILSIIALAAVATALPATSQAADATGFTNYDGERVLISLPSGCTKKDLAKCVLHLVGTTGSCGAAVIEAGANPVADLSCIGSAAGTAANIDECKNCIPK
ncbi:hypothetical protein Q7P35_005819 [Cladosporium inversicolor]